MTWARDKAARAALGLFLLLLTLALASLWLSFRLSTYPIRKLSRDSSVAKRQATVQLALAVFSLLAAVRASAPSSSSSPSPPGSGGSFTETESDETEA